MIVHAIICVRSSSHHPLGDAIETFVRSEDAERFIEEVHGDDPEACELSADRGEGARGGRPELTRAALQSAEKARSRDIHCPVRGIPCDGRAGDSFLIKGADEHSWQPLEEGEHGA